MDHAQQRRCLRSVCYDSDGSFGGCVGDCKAAVQYCGIDLATSAHQHKEGAVISGCFSITLNADDQIAIVISSAAASAMAVEWANFEQDAAGLR